MFKTSFYFWNNFRRNIQTFAFDFRKEYIPLSFLFILFFTYFYFLVMKRDAKVMRGNGPTVFAQVKHDIGVDKILEFINQAYDDATRH